MSVEQAIVQLVVQGAAAVDAEAERIRANLTALEQAAKRAEDGATAAERAAKEAESASRQLVSSVAQTLGRFSQAVSLAKKIAHGAGIEGDSVEGLWLDGAGEVLSTAGTGLSLGASVGGPWGAAIGGLGGGVVGAFSFLRTAEKRLAARAKREQREVARAEKRRAKERDEQLVEELLRQVGLVKLTHSQFGPRQVP